MKKIFQILLLALLVSCNSNDPEEVVISQGAKNYLNEILSYMELYAINKNDIDWVDFKGRVFEEAGTAQSIEDTYDAIRLALSLLEDNHSFFITSEGELLRSSSAVSCVFETLPPVSVPEDVGYVKVESFGGQEEQAMQDFATEIQDQIRTQDNAAIKGWIVDLRQNGGGNMWPMLAGIGPILGEGLAGYFIDADQFETPWGYAQGASWLEQSTIVELANPYQLISTNPKVAVLLDNGIASSGEAIAIAFINRVNTRSFGKPSCGLSTSNVSFSFNDDAVLFLTNAYMADRTKKTYGGSVEPDVDADSNSILQEAIDYILE